MKYFDRVNTYLTEDFKKRPDIKWSIKFHSEDQDFEYYTLTVDKSLSETYPRKKYYLSCRRGSIYYLYGKPSMSIGTSGLAHGKKTWSLLRQFEMINEGIKENNT